MATSVDAIYNPLSTSSASATTKTSNDASTSDRFLTLLVAQMENQDPLNPMDNAQVTSQMAQISTVSGIEKLNTTMVGLNSQFLQSQTLQGAALVGHDVVLAGNTLSEDDEGKFEAMFDLAGPADKVSVEILSAGGKVLDTIEMGALSSGVQSMPWPPATQAIADLATTFRVTAKTGAATVGSTLLTRDRVESVSAGVDGLKLQLSNTGSVTMDQIKTFN